MSDELKIDVLFEEESADQVIILLEETGAQKVKNLKQQGFVGVESIVVAILVIQALVNFLIKLIQIWNVGVTVDVRGARVKVSRESDLPRGTILIISAKGVETKLNQPSGFDLLAFIKGL